MFQRFFAFEFYARAFEECFDHFSDALLHFGADCTLTDQNRETVQILGVLAAQLYGVGPMDPLVLGSVAAVLALVTFAACTLPARRAARIDPIVALSEQ